MQATCLKCGNRAEVSLTAESFSYSLGARAMLCPVVNVRAAKEGGRTSDVNCDHMAKTAQEVARRMRGGRG
jgi:hypothetical protein